MTIPNSITSIGNHAFDGCSGLTSVTIGNSVTSIGYSAFEGCSGLTSPVYNAHVFAYMPTSYSGAYTIPDGIESISGFAFEFCSGLTSVTIPNSVTSIGWGAFHECTGLTNVTIPNSVKSIGNIAFSGCSLTSVTIPNSVTSIESNAFGYCSGLTSMVVENGNTVYDSRDNCNAIIETSTNKLISGCKNTIIPYSVTRIGAGAFEYCSGLTNVTIPNSVTSIENHAFDDCSDLTSVTIGNSVTRIGAGAFYQCIGLTSITCHAEVPPTCGNDAFKNVDKSILVYVPNNSVKAYQTADVWKDFENILPIPDIGPCLIASGTCGTEGDNLSWELSCDGVLTISGIGDMTNFQYYSSSPWYSYRSSIIELSIENSVTSIGDGAFNDCSNLTSVSIGNNVTSIGNYAFSGCSGLTSIEIPNSVTSIGDQAFEGCESLTSFDIPESVNALGNGVWAGCLSLQTLFIPKSVNTIIQNHYGFSVSPFRHININITNGLPSEGALTAFIVDPENPIYTAKDGVLYDKNMTKLIQFPCAKKDAYTIPESVIYIEDYAFYGNLILTELNLPRNVRVIETGAFCYMANLKTLHLPEELVKIGEAGFIGCCNIEELTFGAKLKSIGDQAFTLNLNKCKSITCFAQQVPTLETEYVGAITVGKSTGYIWENWEEVPPSALTVYVPQESIGDYIMDENWGQFTILPITAQQTNVEDLIVEPSSNTVDCSWPAVSGAATYELVIKDKSGNLICTLIFNAQGQLTQLAFSAPSRDNAPEQTQSAGFHFTVTGLNSGTGYDLSLTAKNGSGQEIDKKNVSFHTNIATSIEDVLVNSDKSVKVLMDGQIYILRGDHIFDAQGKMIK